MKVYDCISGQKQCYFSPVKFSHSVFVSVQSCHIDLEGNIIYRTTSVFKVIHEVKKLIL